LKYQVKERFSHVRLDISLRTIFRYTFGITDLLPVQYNLLFELQRIRISIYEKAVFSLHPMQNLLRDHLRFCPFNVLEAELIFGLERNILEDIQLGWGWLTEPFPAVFSASSSPISSAAALSSLPLSPFQTFRSGLVSNVGVWSPDREGEFELCWQMHFSGLFPLRRGKRHALGLVMSFDYQSLV